MAPSEKITINDIARRTGLSKGTVDRVLHNRGEVSKKSYAKVMEAIEELGYEPNVYASLLARGGKRTVAVLLPESDPGSFWELAWSGMDKAAESVNALGVEVVPFGYDQYDIDAFRKVSAEMLAADPSAVVVAPMFKEETELLTRRLEEAGVPYAFVDSKLESSEGYTAYFGMPMYQSGYLCADQLTGGNSVREVLMVRVRRDRHQQSDPTLNRRAGFMDYMLEHNPECTVGNVFIDPNDPAGTEETLSRYFQAHPDVRHIVMFNSRVHLLVPYLEAHPVPGRRVVGFDNLRANMDALRRGTVTALIAQHPDEQVRLAIQALADCVIRKKAPARKDNFMHMDILTRYNVEYY